MVTNFCIILLCYISILNFLFFKINIALGQYDKAAQILDMLDSVSPHKKLIIQRRINLERRRNCNDRVCELYEHYISTANSSLTSILLTVKYARFVWKVRIKLKYFCIKQFLIFI